MSYLKVIYTPESPVSLLELHASRRKPRRNAVLLSNFIDIVMTFLSLHPADLNQLWCTTARPAASTRSTGERLVGTLFVVLLKGNRNLSPQADIYRGGVFFFLCLLASRNIVVLPVHHHKSILQCCDIMSP